MKILNKNVKNTQNISGMNHKWYNVRILKVSNFKNRKYFVGKIRKVYRVLVLVLVNTKDF